MNEALKVISSWKMEAAKENSDRFFYNLPEIEDLYSGEKIFVIGRKGTGKTAIAEHILKNVSFDLFAEKLSFKDFPFHILYDLKDSSYSSQNQYMSLWKFVIYRSICKLLLANNAIEEEGKRVIRKIFPDDIDARLKKAIPNWVSRSFGINILGSGGSFAEKKPEITTERWWEQLEILEEIIEKHTDSNRYFVMFDALDDDYKMMLDKDQYTTYLSLITGLFKASRYVRDHFESIGLNLFPVVFIRDDIYSLIEDNDKNKWKDYELLLEWPRHSLQAMIAHRIARSKDLHGIAGSFKEEWRSIFYKDKIDIGGNRKLDLYDYMAVRTFFRPRDFIFYIRQCAKIANERNEKKIPGSIVRNSEKKYSQYFKGELKDELIPICPQIEEVFNAISLLQKPVFSPREFREKISELKSQGKITKENMTFSPDQLLQILFNFSAIGNRNRDKRRMFKYVTEDAALDLNGILTIHSGLYRGLLT